MNTMLRLTYKQLLNDRPRTVDKVINSLKGARISAEDFGNAITTSDAAKGATDFILHTLDNSINFLEKYEKTD